MSRKTRSLAAFLVFAEILGASSTSIASAIGSRRARVEAGAAVPGPGPSRIRRGQMFRIAAGLVVGLAVATPSTAPTRQWAWRCPEDKCAHTTKAHRHPDRHRSEWVLGLLRVPPDVHPEESRTRRQLDDSIVAHVVAPH